MIDSLIWMSKYAGIRFDLVQAGGGNSSIKLNENEMLVKASGINLSQVSKDQGFVKVDYQLIREKLARQNFEGLEQKQREAIGNQIMQDAKIGDNGKPSIETFLHAMLGKSCLHTHSVAVNLLAATDDWQKDLLTIFPNAVCVPYATPGIDLALAMHKALDGRQPEVIFLQNHGLIVAHEDPKQVIEITNSVTQTIEQHCNINLSCYRNVSRLSELAVELTSSDLCAYYSDDVKIQEFISSGGEKNTPWPFCPDTLIYCGVHPVFINDTKDIEPLKNYCEQAGEFPKVIILNGQVYFIANNMKKAREAEELMKFHCYVTANQTKKINRLSNEEIAYLSNWEAEKYRQGV